MVNHSGGAVAYRIKTPAGDFVFATDNELSSDEMITRMASFCEGAKLLYADVQYRDDEYQGLRVIGPGSTVASRKKWGHSTPSMMVQLYEQMVVAPEVTLIGHHDPRRSDEDLFSLESELHSAIGHLGTEVHLARELQVIPLEVEVPPRREELMVA